MFTEQNVDPEMELAQQCQLLGVLLYFVTFVLPIGFTDRRVSEFGSTLYGFQCACAAVVSIISFNTKFLSTTLAAWVNPLALLAFLVGRFANPSQYKFQPYIFILIVTGLVASSFALNSEAYHPRFGYYFWIASILLITVPELYRWRLSLHPREQR